MIKANQQLLKIKAASTSENKGEDRQEQYSQDDF